jgi:hypothetical protein
LKRKKPYDVDFTFLVAYAEIFILPHSHEQEILEDHKWMCNTKLVLILGSLPGIHFNTNYKQDSLKCSTYRLWQKSISELHQYKTVYCKLTSAPVLFKLYIVLALALVAAVWRK